MLSARSNPGKATAHGEKWNVSVPRLTMRADGKCAYSRLPGRQKGKARHQIYAGSDPVACAEKRVRL
jgi:hypothetical protein